MQSGAGNRDICRLQQLVAAATLALCVRLKDAVVNMGI